MDKTETMTFEIEKNHGLHDKAVKDYSLGKFCVQIHNYDLLCVWLYLRHDSKWPNFISQASKRRHASKSADGFPLSGSCSIWMAKPLNSRVLVRVRVRRVRVVYKRTFTYQVIKKTCDKRRQTSDLQKNVDMIPRRSTALRARLG